MILDPKKLVWPERFLGVSLLCAAAVTCDLHQGYSVKSLTYAVAGDKTGLKVTELRWKNHWFFSKKWAISAFFAIFVTFFLSLSHSHVSNLRATDLRIHRLKATLVKTLFRKFRLAAAPSCKDILNHVRQLPVSQRPTKPVAVPLCYSLNACTRVLKF